MSVAPKTILKGVPAAGGSAAGPVYIAPENEPSSSKAIVDLESAVRAVAGRLEETAAALPPGREPLASILKAQAEMVRDPALAAAIRTAEQGGSTLPAAIAASAESYAVRLAGLDSPYLRDRAADVREVGRLLRRQVTGESTGRLSGLTRPSVVIARELSPADTLGAPANLLLGIVVEEGGVTSHAAIVARELGVPAVVGCTGAVQAAAGHVSAEVDGDTGEVVFSDHAEQRSVQASSERTEPAISPVPLLANVGSLEAALAAARRGIPGIGLFRTEFMFMAEAGPMSEEDQLAVYCATCEALAPHPVTVRTLDVGADKPLPYLPVAAEANPQLGRRGVRMWLAREELWRPQVRALVRAAAVHRNLRVMLPMVAARSEMTAARARFSDEARSLGVAPPQLGMMVEVPGVAAALDVFAGDVDFISLGTNDLTQYTLGADRGLAWDEELGEFNPGVLRLIASAVSAARTLGVPAGVCGELAGRTAGALFLVGVGAGSLSMTADAIPKVANVLRQRGREDCESAARAALGARSARAALACLDGALAKS